MAKKKKKPSKRGKKAYKISLHCSPMIVTQEKKIKKLDNLMIIILLILLKRLLVNKNLKISYVSVKFEINIKF